MDEVIGIATGVSVGIGLAIVFYRQHKESTAALPRIMEALRESGSLTLPELVVKLGMKDGFMNRGKVVNLLNPVVARGELVQTEPPGTTMKDRLSVMRFSVTGQ
ncbi:MAG: hypothetical protein ABI321_19600 [Polyangia bacterium]